MPSSVQKTYKITIFALMKTEKGIETKIKVAWGDMDAMGHVNNVTFIKYLENARVEYLERIMMLKSDRTTQLGPILLQINCRYIQPTFYPDNLTIQTNVTKVGNTSMVLIHEIVSEKLGKVAQGESVVVFYDPIKKEKCIIPDDIKAIIGEIEK